MKIQKSLTVAIAALAVFSVHPAFAANLTWTGGGGNNLWSNPANWGGVTPAANDRLTFAGSTNLSTYNDYAPGTSFQQINFNTGAGPFVLSGNALELTISVSSNGVLQPQIIKLNYSVPTVVTYGYGTLLQVDGAISGAGGTTVVNGGILRLTGSNSYTGISKVDNGNLIVDSIGSVGGGNSNLGTPTTVANGTISLAAATGTGLLTYMGVGETTDRVINLSGTTGSARLNQSGTGHLKFSSALTATGSGVKTLSLQGSTAGTGEIAGAIVDSAGGATGLIKNGSSTWTLSGTNTFTGSTTISAGTLKLNYDTGAGGTNTSKLSDTGILALNGGTVELAGGSHTEAVGSTTLATGGTFITRTSGTSKLAMGAITFTSGAIDFGAASIATTTSSNDATGILSQRATVAGSDFAKNDGSNNIVAYTGYTGFSGTMTASTNYSLAGSGSISGAVGATTNTLKITTTGAGQSLALGANALTVGALLFAGTDDYTISTSAPSKITATSLLNYGSGKLYLGSHNGITQFGTGTTILTATTTTNNNNVLNGGTVQFSNNDQIGNISANRSITLNGGKLVADTTSGSIALNNAGSFSRTFTVNDAGGTLDVIGGNALTISGAITSGANGGPLTFGSASSSGTIILTAANNYQGTTILSGGKVNLGVAEIVGTTGPLGMSRAANPGSILLNGGTMQYSAVNQNDYSGRFATIAGQKYNVDTNGQNVTWATALVSSTGTLTKSGAGNLTLTGANTYSGITTISAGTLLINGDNSGATGSVSVGALGTLGGSGTIGGAVTVAGNLKPGNSPGTLTFNDALTLESTATLTLEITGISGGTFDRLIGDGANTFTFDGTLALDNTGYSATLGDTITVFSNWAAFSGSFDSITGTNLGGGLSWDTSNLGIDGSLTVVPEPATWALLAGSLTVVMVFRRRR